jgi:hypothetical protein
MLSLLRRQTTENTVPLHEDLQELLTYMIRYGKPRLSYLDKGWYCKVEMNTNTTGTQFDVASEFGMPTPIQAAKQCNERIENALKALAQ